MNAILLILSLLGFFLFFRRVSGKLQPAFYPALTVSMISSVLVLGGAAGQLFLTGKILFWAGIGLFLVYGLYFLRHDLLRKPAKNRKPFTWLICTFCLFCTMAMILLRNRFLYNYDDFSHWGLVAKILLEESRLPVSRDGLLFPSYPPGAAAFICYCCSVIGSGEGAFQLAQAIMLISFLLSLQSAAKDRAAGYLLTTLAVPVFAFYTTPLDSLAVDNLLGASFLSALLIYFQNREKMKYALLPYAIILSCVVMMKNSGLLMAVFAVGLVLIHDRREGKKISRAVLSLMIPFLVYLIWRVYLKMNFDTFGKHYMSLSVYYGTFKRRLGELGMILRVILPVMANPMKNHAIWLIPSFAAVYLISPARLRPQQKTDMIICAILFFLYEAGVIAMYFFSMGTGEFLAHNGGDFVRYNGTIICVLAGLFLCMTVRTIRSMNRENKRNGAAALAALLAAGWCMSLNRAFLPSLEEARKAFPDASAFSGLMISGGEKETSEGTKYLILVNEPEATDYHVYMAKYYLRGAERIEICGTEEKIPDGNGHEDTLLIDLRGREISVFR